MVAACLDHGILIDATTDFQHVNNQIIRIARNGSKDPWLAKGNIFPICERKGWCIAWNRLLSSSAIPTKENHTQSGLKYIRDALNPSSLTHF